MLNDAVMWDVFSDIEKFLDNENWITEFGIGFGFKSFQVGYRYSYQWSRLNAVYQDIVPYRISAITLHYRFLEWEWKMRNQ